MLLKVKEAVLIVLFLCYWIIWGFCSDECNYFIIKMIELQVHLVAQFTDFIDDLILGIQLNK